MRRYPFSLAQSVFGGYNQGWPSYPPQGLGTIEAAAFALRHPWINLPRDDYPFDASCLYAVQSRKWSENASDNDPWDMLLLRGTGWIYRLTWRISRPWTLKLRPSIQSAENHGIVSDITPKPDTRG